MFRPVNSASRSVLIPAVTAAPLPSKASSTQNALQDQRTAPQLQGAGQGGLGNAAGPFAGTRFKPRLEAPAKDQPINTIYINPDTPGSPNANAVPALQEIGKRRGFNVETRSGATADVWAEDNAIVFRDQAGKSSLLVSSLKGKEFLQAKSDFADFAVLLSNLKGEGYRQGISSLPDVESVGDASVEYKHFGSIGLLGRAFSEEHSLEVGKAAKASGWDVRSTPLGIEGGNLLSMRNRAGEPVALLGRNTLLTNWRVLANTKQLDPAAVNQALATKSFDASLASEFKQIAKEAGKGLADAQANRMAAEVEVTKGAIAKALNLDKKNVVVIEQAGFHIDMETRPIGNNKVMVSDLNASVQVLKQSIAELRATAPSAAKGKAAIDAEIKQLESLRTRTQDSIEQGDQHLLDRKAKTLRSAGIEVVRAATNFGEIASEYSPLNSEKIRRGPVNVNFANGIAATDKRGIPYFITNVSASDTLNRYFSESMKKKGIEVEWTPTGTLLDRMGGIDCITLHSRRQVEPQRLS